MRPDTRRPGSAMTFIDATSGEDIFQVGSDENGLLFLSFHLYDSNGCCVAESDGPVHYPDGLVVRCDQGEVLLDVPAEASSDISYRLYNSSGHLLTTSDGTRTKIFPLLRMEGVAHNWVPVRPERAV